jgi:hypothetical protein
MHDRIRRKLDTEVAEEAHETRRGNRCMMRVGKNESPLATQRTNSSATFAMVPNPKTTRAGNAVY